MHKKILLGTGAILVGFIMFIIGLILINNNPKDVLAWTGIVGAILIAFSPTSILTALMMILNENSDQKDESD